MCDITLKQKTFEQSYIYHKTQNTEVNRNLNIQELNTFKFSLYY